MGAIGSFGKLSPVVDNHTFPEFIWKAVNYLMFSPSPTGIDGGFEHTNCMAQILHHSLLTQSTPSMQLEQNITEE